MRTVIRRRRVREEMGIGGGGGDGREGAVWRVGGGIVVQFHIGSSLPSRMVSFVLASLFVLVGGYSEG